ncbi:MAG: ribonuclease HI family protein [bacterium]|nr:ribonuclease HI family protein [bacterium]
MEKIIVHTDGGARGNPGPAGAGIVIADGKGKVLKEISQFLGNGTNNFAEYQAVATALHELKKHFGKKTKTMKFEIKLDSELVKKQLAGEYQIKEPGLVPLFIEIHNLCVANFPNVVFTHVRREQNKRADELANEAMDKA